MKKIIAFVMIMMSSMVSAETISVFGTPYGLVPTEVGQIYIDKHLVGTYKANSLNKGDWSKVIEAEVKSSSDFVASDTTAVMPTSGLVVISAGSADDVATLPDGEEGQQVTVIMAECADSAKCVVSSDKLNGGTTLTFDAVGENAVLVFTKGKWFMISGTATLAE